MGVATFSRNSVVEIEGTRYLLYRRIKGTCWQLESMGDHSFLEREERALQRLFINHKLKFVSGVNSTWGRVEHIELSPAQIELVTLRRKYVLAVAHLPFTEKVIRAAISKVWEKEKKPVKLPGWITVWRWMKRYFAFGEDGNALLDKNGGKRQREEIYGPAVLQICEDAIEELYLCLERGTIQDVLDRSLARVGEEQRRLDEEYERYPDNPKPSTLRLPTKRLIKRLLAEEREFDKYEARHGHEAAIMKFRSIKGHDITTAPLQEIQVDHTKLDLFVVDDETGLPLGRPYLTVCIDNYTRCILGVYIGFTPPSSLSVALCLKDSFLPKDYETLYPEIENEMPYGVGRRLKIDNGLEMHGKQLEQGCLSLGMIIQYCPRRKAWYKGKVERAIRTLNDQVAHRLKGTSFANIFEKGEYDPKKHAVVTLTAARKGVRKWIADVYHQRPHRTLHVPPMQLWSSSISPDQIRVPDDPTVLDAVMGRPDVRTLTHKGIEYKGLFYNSEELAELRKDEGDKLTVDIRVDEENIGHLYVIWDNACVIEAKALDFEYANGISAWQHKQFQYYRRTHNLPDTSTGWLKAKEDVRSIFEEGFLNGKARKGIGRHRDRGEGPKTITPQSNAEVALAKKDASATNPIPEPAERKSIEAYEVDYLEDAS